MKTSIRTLIFLFILIESSYLFAEPLVEPLKEPLLPVNLTLQFETDVEQSGWSINENFENFPHIFGDRGGIHRSWDNFIRKVTKKQFTVAKSGKEKFGETVIKEISLDSSFQKDTLNYLVTITIKVAVENRELFEYFINNEYIAYHSTDHNKGHIFYAAHQADDKPAIARIPTLQKQPFDSSILNQIPKNRKDRFLSVLNSAIKSEDVKDPETQLVKELSGLAVNWSLIKTLENIKLLTDYSEAQTKLMRWMQTAIEFGVNALDGELLRLPVQRVSSLYRFLRLSEKGLPKKITVDEKRVALFMLYKQQIDDLQVMWYKQVSHITTNADIDNLVNTITSSIEKPANLRYLHVRKLASLPVRKIARRITNKEFAKVHHAENVEQKVDHNYTVYSLSSSPINKALPEMSNDELLAYYAPDIIQSQQINQLKYNPSMD
ncbi:MAG: hypothetical protein ACUZ8H_03530, partial [Candidatus Anammoxibacter sp.]